MIIMEEAADHWFPENFMINAEESRRQLYEEAIKASGMEQALYVGDAYPPVGWDHSIV